jgi:hypothetical protein
MRAEAATLEALYNINKHAKRYGRRADEDYQVGKGAGAKSNSLKKKALYGAKSVVIKKLVASGPTRRPRKRGSKRNFVLSMGSGSQLPGR